jgi:hypothetical protein
MWDKFQQKAEEILSRLKQTQQIYIYIYIYKEVQQDHRTVPQTNVGFHARYPLTLLRTLHFEKM